MTTGAGVFLVEMLRCSPDLLDVVAQVLWVAAPQRRIAAAPVDAAGLVPVLADAPLAPREETAFERGLDALLREEASHRRGIYLREVRDGRGVRRELGVPCAPLAWAGSLTMVGPFEDEAAALRWQRDALVPPLVGDLIRHGGRLYVDVFSGDGDASTAAPVVDTSDDPG